MTRRARAGRFILTTEHHPHGTHLKIRSTKSPQMLVVVEEEIEPLANAMLSMASPTRGPAMSSRDMLKHRLIRYRVRRLDTRPQLWTVHRAVDGITTCRAFPTWQQAINYANQKAAEANQ